MRWCRLAMKRRANTRNTIGERHNNKQPIVTKIACTTNMEWMNEKSKKTMARGKSDTKLYKLMLQLAPW